MGLAKITQNNIDFINQIYMGLQNEVIKHSLNLDPSIKTHEDLSSILKNDGNSYHELLRSFRYAGQNIIRILNSELNHSNILEKIENPKQYDGFEGEICNIQEGVIEQTRYFFNNLSSGIDKLCNIVADYYKIKIVNNVRKSLNDHLMNKNLNPQLAEHLRNKFYETTEAKNIMNLRNTLQHGKPKFNIFRSMDSPYFQIFIPSEKFYEKYFFNTELDLKPESINENQIPGQFMYSSHNFEVGNTAKREELINELFNFLDGEKDNNGINEKDMGGDKDEALFNTYLNLHVFLSGLYRYTLENSGKSMGLLLSDN